MESYLSQVEKLETNGLISKDFFYEIRVYPDQHVCYHSKNTESIPILFQNVFLNLLISWAPIMCGIITKQGQKVVHKNLS